MSIAATMPVVMPHFLNPVAMKIRSDIGVSFPM